MASGFTTMRQAFAWRIVYVMRQIAAPERAANGMVLALYGLTAPTLALALIDSWLTLLNATVATSAFTDTFTPQPASALSPVCPTDPAPIKITKTGGVLTGDVNEPISIQPADDDGIFRIVDCKYMYNLATSSLSGVGTYQVSAVINGVTATNPAIFDLK